MKEIRMVDLKGQYDRIRPEIDQAIAEVIQSTAFINGPAVQKFAKSLEEYLQVKHVIPCANGTDALQVAMMALNLQPGDEVITSTFTFIATVETIALLKLKPVLVDVCPHTFNLDIEAVKKAISPKTKAILPVHLFGQCAPMDELRILATNNNLWIIEDACQAIGADYLSSDGSRRKAGTIGEIGCTSFFPSKNLGCFGDGGALFTNNDLLAENIRSIVNHGMKIRYYHDQIGVNSRLDSIQAAILSVKLNYLDQYNTARQQAAAYYFTHLNDIGAIHLPEQAADSSHVFHQFTMKVPANRRDQLQAYLAEKGIPAMIYYPVPIHLQKAYESFSDAKDHFPVAEQLAHEVISLPMHSELEEDQLRYICDSIREFFQLNM
jgi:UDP-2-acetamido-2-deoxy-ribo-hexuluronate aminotransferase